MQCPFLRKLNVKFCGLHRSTMIPLNLGSTAAEQCAGPGFRDCSLVREDPAPIPCADHCPHLSVGEVYFCSVAPVQKLIPCNRTIASRCTDGGHRYCQLFISMTEGNPTPEEAAQATPPPETREQPDLDFSMPDTLAYAPNHLWLDLGDGPTCHVGVDAFFGRAVGRIDEVVYPHFGDNRRPVVRFKAAGVDFDLVFPNVMQAYEINAHLLADPSAVLNDPYGRGWLFEGIPLPGKAPRGPHPLEKGLTRGTQARRWMHQECDRLAGFVHEHLREHDECAGHLVQDGGSLRGSLAASVDRPVLVRLHQEFFSLHPGRTAS